MAIYRILKNSTVVTQEAAAMAEAYERALSELGIADRSDPRTESIALAILALLRDGETDPARLAQLAGRAVGRESNGAEQGGPQA